MIGQEVDRAVLVSAPELPEPLLVLSASDMVAARCARRVRRDNGWCIWFVGDSNTPRRAAA